MTTFYSRFLSYKKTETFFIPGQYFTQTLTMKRIISLFVLSCFTLLVFSQSQQPVKERKNGWHLLDQQDDGYMGISLQKAYDLLKGRKSSTVIVAVIDSGIDTAQEDLRDIL